MAGNLSRSAPTPINVLNMMPNTGYTGTLMSATVWIRVPHNATSTGTGTLGQNWINPENGTVMGKPYWCFTTAGTGTFIAGRSDDGTGSSNTQIEAGGTMTIGVCHRVASAATLVTGTIGERAGYMLVGPGGTGTNNCFVAAHTDTPTSTAKGYMLVQYVRVSGSAGVI